ncbi:F-type H+-transporting ATPase subunit b [Elusimicrobium simillimum]|uniref:F0F1 ATP synthase subunit B n=1 Tax=Elusimicrobium simillimum TaxID=3143438 RepID=UPI003C705391
MDKLLSPDYGLLVWTIVNFFLLVFVLGKFAWKPLIKALEDRENKIAEDKAQALKARDDAQKIKDELDQRLKNIASEAQAKMQQVTALAESQKQSIIEEGKRTSSSLVDQAKAQIEAEKDKALAEVKKSIAEISLLAAEKVAGVKMDAKADADLLKNILTDIESKKDFKA